ncbi:hypothetical protein [Nostoc sp. DSM 114167]|uniref:hypothetical protein n=1 Tax=Nostoc sp. DSM 114167 TaxID=3439050 RepID=UPI004045346D
MSTTETPPHLGFTDVQQSFSPVPDCIDARTSRNARKITNESRVGIVQRELRRSHPEFSFS